jgi:DNA-binding Xre family transcriptional regulator
MNDVMLTAMIDNRIKVRMAEEGFRSVQVLASETGISANTLYAVVNGKHTNLSLENVCKLLWVLDCRFEDLFQYDITSNEPSDTADLSDAVQAGIEAGRREYEAKYGAISAIGVRKRRYKSIPDTRRRA